MKKNKELKLKNENIEGLDFSNDLNIENQDSNNQNNNSNDSNKLKSDSNKSKELNIPYNNEKITVPKEEIEKMPKTRIGSPNIQAILKSNPEIEKRRKERNLIKMSGNMFNLKHGEYAKSIPLYCNTCITANNYISTNEGIFQLKDLIGKDFKVLSHTGRFNNARIIEKGIKQVGDYISQEGYMISGITPDHNILTKFKANKNELWKPISRLRLNEFPVISKPGNFGNIGDWNFGFIIGCILGDGSLIKCKNGYWLVSFAEHDSYIDVLIKFKSIFEIYIKKEINIHRIGSMNKVSFRGNVFLNHLVEFGVNKKEIQVPDKMFRMSKKCVSGFISGLFSCDGYVNSQKKWVALYIKSRLFLSQIQILLANYGILTNIYRQYEAGNPNRIENSQELWCLSIRRNSIEIFKNEIGIYAQKKNIELLKIKQADKFIRNSFKKNRFQVTGQDQVYDISVENDHSFVCNGIVLHNCYAGLRCPYYLKPEEGQTIVCAIREDFAKWIPLAKTRDKDQLLEMLDRLREIQASRIGMNLYFENLDGGIQDKALTILIKLLEENIVDSYKIDKQPIVNVNQNIMNLTAEIAKSGNLDKIIDALESEATVSNEQNPENSEQAKAEATEKP